MQVWVNHRMFLAMLLAALLALQGCSPTPPTAEGVTKRVNEPDSEGKTQLQKAVENGRIPEVTELLAKGASVSAGGGGKSLLHLAAEKGSLPVVKLLVDHGGDVKALTQSEKGTMLHFAGSRPVAEFFVSQGLGVSTNNLYRETPLHLAAKRGQAEVVSYLLEKGADPNAKARDMDVSVLNYASTRAVAELLLTNGAMPNGSTNQWGRVTPPILTAAREGRVEVVACLIEKGADVNASGSHGGSTALDQAVEMGRVDVVKLLLGKGGVTSPRSGNSHTLLSMAAHKGHTETVLALLDAGLNPNEEGKNPPLYEAAQNGDAETVKMLLDHGADPNKHGSWPPALSAAAAGKSRNTMYLLALKKGKSTPETYLACMKLLLEKGADPRDVNLSKITALHVAATHNFKEGVALLLEKGADPNAKDRLDSTPLHWAAINNSLDAATLLLAKGADPNAPLNDQAAVVTTQPWEVPNPFGGRKAGGQRPLDLSTSPEFKALLTKAGANPNLPPAASLSEKAPVDEDEQARRQVEAYRRGAVKPPPPSPDGNPFSTQPAAAQATVPSAPAKLTLKVTSTNTSSQPPSAVVDGQSVEEGKTYTSVRSGVTLEYKVLKIESEQITISHQGREQIIPMGTGLDAFTE